jgi:gamma-glutamylputrescine oxidase
LQQSVKPAASWYEATVDRGAGFSPLLGQIDADVCVVGGGFAGLVTALEAQRASLSTVVLEGSRVACAASGRNGGFVSNGFAQGISSVRDAVGLQAAQALYAYSRDGTAFVRDFISGHCPEANMGTGMRVALRQRKTDELAAHSDMMRNLFGETVYFEGTADTRAAVQSERYHASLVFPEAFHIHPLRYGLTLAAQVVQAGGRIFENSKAASIFPVRDGHHVSTANGVVRARQVVICVSAYDLKLHRPTARAILPVATYVAVTEPLNQDAIRTNSAIADTRRAGDYYRRLPDGRILWGGRITTRVHEPSHLAERMRGDMLSVFPQLGQPRMDFAWPGLMAYALHKMPLIGRTEDGIWHATGFGGHGINTTAMGGLLVARGLANIDDGWKRFSPFGPRSALGPLGRVGVQGSYWWMQLRDRWDEGFFSSQ